ncbi:MAG: monovalent cation/H(+) antiporter subunit G [Gloeobacterales cyanobacterium]
MQEGFSAFLMIVGIAFMSIAALGIVRMPDLFLRTSVTSKASTLGISCILLAVAVHFNDLGVTSRVLATIAFMLLTAPVAAHVLGRAGYAMGVSLWKGTVRDEWGHSENSVPSVQDKTQSS